MEEHEELPLRGTSSNDLARRRRLDRIRVLGSVLKGCVCLAGPLTERVIAVVRRVSGGMHRYIGLCLCAVGGLASIPAQSVCCDRSCDCAPMGQGWRLISSEYGRVIDLSSSRHADNLHRLLLQELEQHDCGRGHAEGDNDSYQHLGKHHRRGILQASAQTPAPRLFGFLMW